MLQVGTGDVEAADHSQNLPLLKVRHNGQAEKVVLDKQFQGPVERIIGSQRLHIASHQVFAYDEGLQRRGLRSEMDFLQVDHAHEAIVGISHWQDGVRRVTQPVDDFGERILSGQCCNALAWCEKPANSHLGQDFPHVSRCSKIT